MSSEKFLSEQERALRAKGIISLMEHVSRHIYEQRTPNALHAVQWAALRYFARSGEKTRTVAGLAKYLGVTSAPASRTASSLLKRKLITSAKSSKDGRSNIFSLTAFGQETMLEDPIIKASEIICELQDSDITQLAVVLDKVYSRYMPEIDVK